MGLGIAVGKTGVIEAFARVGSGSIGKGFGFLAEDGDAVGWLED